MSVSGDKPPFQPTFISVDYAVFTDPDLSHAAKLLFARLKLYAERDGKAYPKHGTLAREMCLTDRQVRTILNELKALNRITWTRTRGSCRYEIKPPEDWMKTSDLDRKECSHPTRKKASDQDRQKSSDRKEVRKSSSERKVGIEEEHKPERHPPSMAGTEGNSKPRSPFENPEIEFQERMRERHDGAVDSSVLLADVKSELGDIPLSEFLEADLKATTAPAKLTNPHGHYRKLARKLKRKAQVAALESVRNTRHRIEEYMARGDQGKFVPACSCNDGFMPDGSYCACDVGTVRRQLDDLNRAKSNGGQSAENGISP